MIRALHIRNLRGIQTLDVEDLGRVNLVLGRNESGKTTFLAAAGMQAGLDNWPFIAPYLDDPRPADLDLERHFLPLFGGCDPASPVHVWATRVAGEDSGWRMELSLEKGRAAWPAKFTADPGDGRLVTLTPSSDGDPVFTPDIDASAPWWSPAFVEPEHAVFGSLLELYKAGRTSVVVTALREVNPRIENVEIAGQDIFVRLSGYPLPLRFGVLGDGARRLLEFALAMNARWSPVLIDELENGFHYTTLPTVLRMLQSGPPTTQIFATTHRDELIRTACEVFLAKGDDGLRIIRLDKGESEHRAVVYSAEQALAGMDSGLELRG